MRVFEAAMKSSKIYLMPINDVAAAAAPSVLRPFTKGTGMRPRKAWVLIADGARARLIIATRHSKKLDITEISEFSADHSPNRELTRDAASRVYESHGSERHAIVPKSDPHRALKRDFATTLADSLDAFVTREKVDALIVAAAPVTLGDLRKTLSNRVKNIIVAELAMDLTKVRNADLASHIGDALPM